MPLAGVRASQLTAVTRRALETDAGPGSNGHVEVGAVLATLDQVLTVRAGTAVRVYALHTEVAATSARPWPRDDLHEDNARHVRVIEYEVPDRDGNGELIALITTITEVTEAPAVALAEAYHQRLEHETGNK